MGRLRRIWNSASIPFANAKPMMNMWARLHLRPSAGGWTKRVRKVIGILETVITYDMLYIGGGNARLIEPPLPANVKTVSNMAGITGGVRLWDGRMIRHSPTGPPLLLNSRIRLHVGLQCKFNQRLYQVCSCRRLGGVADGFNSRYRHLSEKIPWEQCPGMAGDLLVFLRGENAHRAARCGIVDGIVRGPVPSCVEGDTDPGQAAADRSACSPIVFSNAAGEDNQIDSIKRGDHRGHLLAHTIAEHLNGKSCIGV